MTDYVEYADALEQSAKEHPEETLCGFWEPTLPPAPRDDEEVRP